MSSTAPLAKDLEATAPRVEPGFVRTALVLAVKDLRLEWRGRARVNATVFFAILTLLLFSFAAGPIQKVLSVNAPGYLWLAIVLASVLMLGESMRVEADNDALEGVRLLGADARAVFLAKALVNALFLCALGVLLVPLSVALYGVELVLGFGPLLTTIVLGCFAISAPGTLYSAIAAQARAKDVLLPLLLFPVLVPGLLAAVRCTALIMQGDPMGQLGSWLRLLMGFNVVYWVLATVLFGRVIEE